jgi:hypothetical protein
MNIFYIHKDPIVAAQMLADDHIRKMQIESAQMLCTAHWETGGEAPYKRAHKNHPSTIWTRQSLQHYKWLLKHGLEICYEFEKRYGKRHATQAVLEWCELNIPNIPNVEFVEPPLCMPEEFKIDDAIGSYRNFYINDKVKIKKLDWKKNPEKKPNWVL